MMTNLSNLLKKKELQFFLIWDLLIFFFFLFQVSLEIILIME